MHPVKTKEMQFRMGIIFILLVNLLWWLSSYLVKNMYDNQSSIPFFTTYVSTVIFTIYLIPYSPFLCISCISGSKRIMGNRMHCSQAKSVEISGDRKNLNSDTDDAFQKVWVAQDIKEIDMLGEGSLNSQLTMDTYDEKGSYVKSSDRVAFCYFFVIKQNSDRLPLPKTVGFSMGFCLLWFCMNYTQNMSLEYTNQWSSTALMLLCGPFVLIQSRLVLKRSLSSSKIVGGMMVVVGSLLLFVKADVHSKGDSPTVGYTLAVMSAIFGSIWSTLMEFCFEDDSKLSMILFLGLIGLFNGVFLFPLFFVFDYFRFEIFEMPDKHTWLLLTINSFSNILADYLWVRSFLLTSPEIAATGVVLTVPMSILSDYLKNEQISYFQYVAATLMVIGFVFVSMSRNCSIKQETDLRDSLIPKEIRKEDKEV